jgi:hypothetical protein
MRLRLRASFVLARPLSIRPFSRSIRFGAVRAVRLLAWETISTPNNYCIQF